MYRLRVYVFCSVLVHASLGVLSLLGGVLETEGLPPSNDTIYNGSEVTFRFKPLTTLKKIVWNPLAKKFGKVTSAIIPTSSESVCYDVVGCFPMGSPWKTILRPIGAPMGPEKIAASAYFFSRENTSSKSIHLYPKINLEGISFMPNRTTVVIVHGFTSTVKASWVKNLTDVYLKSRDVNLFCVDWADGARSLNYLQVASNTRVVGKELALLINKLIQEYKARADDFHLIGHSLGAHICSYAAKEIPGIGHLTALDPAQPAFEGFNAKVRLDKSDAKFVEVLHTDSRPFIPTLGFGMITSYGHIDFYFNGFYQPGCLIPKPTLRIHNLESIAKISVEILTGLISCAHIRAYEYYTEAIDSSKCTFWGRKIKLWKTLELFGNTTVNRMFKMPNFLTCTTKTCIPLGLTVKDSPLRGVFLVFTKTRSPYCRRLNASHNSVELVRHTDKGFLKELPKVKLL